MGTPPKAHAASDRGERQVAEAQINLRRVQYARHQLLSNALADPYYGSRANGR
jgi:hypothetical protein